MKRFLLTSGVIVCACLLLAGSAFGQDEPAPAAAEVSAEVTTTTEEVTTAVAEAGDEAVAAAEEAAEDAGPSDEMFTVNNVWMMVSTFLVFVMHLGFATLETGLERAKNATNILFKNTMIPAIGLLTFAFCGFNIAYPGDSWWAEGYVGIAMGPWLSDVSAADVTSGYNPGYTYWTDFLFQGMFAATAATIVSGAVAGRVKLLPFLIFSTVYVAIAYPIVVSWEWGGGFLSENFHDFAGSTMVHSVGGWGALVGAIMLGPRTGKYVNGSVKAIPGHNMGLCTIGVFLLWLGWFGFNGGSVLSADPGATSRVLVTTNLAAAAGIVFAAATSWIVQKKPDFTMVLNGCLAGLVGITAPADVVSPFSAVIIGAIAGVLVVFAVLIIDRVLKIDDPVGAISVHLVCGIWGTLAVGIFKMEGTEDGGLGAQITGVLATGAFCLIFAGILFAILKFTVGIRVSKDEEAEGLDIGEHGMEAYSGFQVFVTQ